MSATFILLRMALRMKNQNKTDMVNSPPHYARGKIECIDAIQEALTPAEFKGYIKGNIIKYLWREQNKGGIEDWKKALWYLNRFIKVSEK